MYPDLAAFEKTLKFRLLSWSLLQVTQFLEKQNLRIEPDKEKEFALNWRGCKECVEQCIPPELPPKDNSRPLDDAYMAAIILRVLERALRGAAEIKIKRASEIDRMQKTRPPFAKRKPSKLEQLKPGQFLEDYEILEELGRGAMGVVYLTRHQYLKKRFAVKVLSQQYCNIPDFASLFLQEAQMLGNLKHPNIVEVHNFGIEDDAQYLAVEYIDGGTVEDLLARSKGQIPIAKTHRILHQLLSGLEHAHGKGIIHRDLKPENLLLDREEQVIITDFGLAKLHDSDTIQRMAGAAEGNTIIHLAKEQSKRAVAVGGTKGYMAPEVELGAVGDMRSDIYAVGVIIYYLLTGQPYTSSAAPASTLVKKLDPRWDALIRHCTEHDPDKRYQKVSDILRDLQHLRPRVRASRRRLPLLVVLLVLSASCLWWTERQYPGMMSAFWSHCYSTYRVEEHLQHLRETVNAWGAYLRGLWKTR